MLCECIMELCYIASYDDLCMWCRNNRPEEFDESTLLEWTKCQGKHWMHQTERVIIFNLVSYISGNPHMKEMYIEDGIFNDDRCLFHFIYYGKSLETVRKKTHYISIGEFCLTSCVLKELKVKEFSLPFDWIFSNPTMVYNCINDAFTTFLDRTKYETLCKDKKCRHTEYGNIFNHHDPCENNDDYRYFERCVERFKKLCLNPTEHVSAFITHSIGEDLVNELELYRTIKNILPEHFELVVIGLKYDEDKETEYSLYSLERNLHIYIMQHKSFCTGVNFTEEYENQMYNSIILSHIRPVVVQQMPI